MNLMDILDPGSHLFAAVAGFVAGLGTGCGLWWKRHTEE